MTVKRLNYFDHQFLRAKDFNDEQKYHLDMRRRHNRTLHTPGIAEGFKVDPDATAVIIQPGMAVDGQGREIILLESVRKNLSGLQGGTLFITVAHDERPTDSTSETGVQGETRWTESALIGISPTAPTNPDIQLLIAKVTRDGTKITAVDETGRLIVGAKGAAASSNDMVVNSLTLKRAGDAEAARPALSCSAANQMALTNGSLKLDPGREIFFQDTGQIRSFDGNHKLVFNRQSDRLELHEFGDILFLTGGSAPSERMRIKGDGGIGIGTAGLTLSSVTDATRLGLNIKGQSADGFGIYLENASNVGRKWALLSMGPSSPGLPSGSFGLLDTGAGIYRLCVTAGGNLGVGVPNPGDNFETAGNVRILNGSNPIRFTSNWSSYGDGGNKAEISNDTSFYKTLMIVGNGSSGTRKVSVWDRLEVWGTLHINGNLTATGGKGGYVMDQFVNNLGETLEQGDVVIIGSNQATLFYSKDSNIPIPEVDLAAEAYDTRVCGVVCEVFGKVTEEGEPAEGESKAGKGKRGKAAAGREAASLCARELTAGEREGRDHTKIEPGQIGFMVTLGAFAHCKVDADAAPIEVGDLLTTSATRGHAQKVTDRAQAAGAILGKALGSLKKGKGIIPIMVTLQ